VYEALLVAVGTLVTAIAAALVMLYRTWDRSKARQQRTAVTDYQEIVRQQWQKTDLVEKQSQELRAVLNEVIAEVLDCHVERAEVYGDLTNMHECCTRLTRALERLGEHPGEVTPLRPRPKGKGGRIEFLQRTVEHNAALVEEAKTKTIPPPSPPTSGS
jgi:hypothetical protein